MRRIMTAGLVMALAAGSLVACGDKGKDSGSAKVTGDYKTTYGDKTFDNVKVSVELFDRSNAPEGSTILNNRWTKYAQEQMKKVGIDIEYVVVPRADEITKMQTMMASQTAPDLTLTYTYAYAEDYYRDGGLWDLTPFVDGEAQAKNLKTYLGKEVMDIGRNKDALYGIVARRATTANSNMFIRQDWLEKLGGKTPSTPDELYKYIKACVEKNPDNVNGMLGGFFSLLESGTTATSYRNSMSLAFSNLKGDETELSIADGYDFYYDPGYKEYLKFLNKLYNEKLMNQEFYASTTDSFVQEMVNGKYAFYESNVGYNVDPLRNSPETTLRENYPNAKFVSIPNLKNVNDQQQYAVAYSPGGLIIMCPKTATEQKVEAAMTYLDWMSTKDGGFVFYHGFENEHFTYNEKKIPIVKNTEFNKKDKDWIRTDLFLVGNQGYFASVEDFNECTAAENPKYSEDVIRNYENSLTGKAIHSSTYSSEKETETKNDFVLLRSKYQVQCISCKPGDFDKIFDEWISEAKKVGVEDIIKERTEHFKAQR